MGTFLDVAGLLLGIIVIYVVPICLAIVIMRVLAARAAKRRRKAVESTEWHWEYAKPDLNAFRARFGIDMPPPLVELYADEASAGETEFSLEDPCYPGDFYIGAVVSSFVPATTESFDLAQELIGEGTCIFAGDGCGDYFYIRTGEVKDGDAPVYFYDHEGAPCGRRDDSLAAFLRRKRLRDDETPAERAPRASEMYQRVLADGRPLVLPEERLGPGIMFWAPAPIVLIFMVFITFFTPKATAGAIIVTVALDALLLCLMLVLYDHERFRWAGRVVGAVIFLACAAYLISELIASRGVITIGEKRSQPSVLNASLALLTFGVPGLLYAIFGRLPGSKGKG